MIPAEPRRRRVPQAAFVPIRGRLGLNGGRDLAGSPAVPDPPGAREQQLRITGAGPCVRRRVASRARATGSVRRVLLSEEGLGRDERLRRVLIVLMTSALVVAIWTVAKSRLVSIVQTALETVCGDVGC